MIVMTVREYATHIKSSVSSVRKLIDDGVIPACKIGKAYKIDTANADTALSELMQEKAYEQRNRPGMGFRDKLKGLSL